MPNTITINGQQYDEDQLGEAARQQLVNINAVDAEIRHLRAQLAMYETARNAYARELQQHLPKKAD